MRRPPLSSTSHLPSFSLIIETENLDNASLDNLLLSLISLDQQDISLGQAKEVWLINSGQVSTDYIHQLQNRFPWIQVYCAPYVANYYHAKMLGAQRATGEIVVYGDSDCIYETTWLRHILTPFSQNPDIQVVAGETRTRGKGPYGLAMTLAYIFPPYSRQTTLAETSQYFLNNVAFRRELLRQHPIPTDLTLYRGHCVIHVQKLQQLGYTIWRQPQARATHAPPEGLTHFFWRFLLIGHDYYWQRCLLDSHSPSQSLMSDSFFSLKGKIHIFLERFRAILKSPLQLFYLPLAIPIILAALILMSAGYFITLLSPKYLLTVYRE